MAASFDPYREWLGIQEPRKAISYYRLFRLKAFEADPAMIAAAADATIARVREINTESATLGELQARLLSELTAARGCLLDPAARGRYDARLLERLAEAEAPVPMAVPVGTVRSARPAEADSGSIQASLWQESTAVPRQLQHQVKKSGWQTAASFALAAALVGAISIAVWQMQSGPIESGSAAQGQVAGAVPDNEPPRQQFSQPMPQVGDIQPGTAGRPDEPDEPLVQLPLTAAAQEPSPAAAIGQPAPREPSATPAAAPTFRRSMNQARSALVARDLKRASDELARAGQNATTPQQLAEVKRLATLHAQVERFFDVVRAGLQRLEPTDEIRIGDWVAVVVARGPEGLALFDEGSRRDYTLATLPAKVALFAARAGADEKSPQMKLAAGAFQAVDPEGDRGAAQRLWSEAASTGQEIDDLLPFLDSAALAVSRDPVPEPSLLSLADERIEKEFASAIESAKSPAEKSELAVKLMANARDAENPVDQYALVKRAAKLAISAADARLALQAGEELARWFDVDGLALAAGTLNELNNQRPAAATARYMARRALELAEEAKSQKRGELAKTLADTALASARKVRDPELVKRVTDRRREYLPRAGSATKKSRKGTAGE